MAEIIPAVLASDFAELEARLETLIGLTKAVHLDVSDGAFTPNLTWPFKPQDEERFRRIKNEEEGLPFWKEFDFEVHLMVNKPERVIEAWRTAGASRIIVHAEALKDAEVFGKLFGVERGIALNLATPVDVIAPLAAVTDCIQCMGIRRVGFQGEQFDDAVIERIRELKRRYPDKPVSVDGGVNRETAPRLVEAGADRLVIGSAIVESDDIAAELQYFQNL